jgi:hypothetical protein
MAPTDVAYNNCASPSSPADQIFGMIVSKKSIEKYSLLILLSIKFKSQLFNIGCNTHYSLH